MSELRARTVRPFVIAGLAVAIVAEALLLLATIQPTFDTGKVFRPELMTIAVFGIALLLLARSGLGGRAAVRLVVGVGALFQLLALTRRPVDSDDDFRYLWDAKVQLAGVDPYRYAPSSAGLTPVRDPFLFPPGTPCASHPFAGGGCTRINLPTVHTIYPPVAEAMFALVRILSFGGHGRHLPLQLAGGLGCLAVGWLLARRAVAEKRPVWTVAMWSWCPVTVIELGNNAHVDWLAVLLGVLALTVSARGRPIVAGLLLGAGIATKLYPALLGASMLRRRPLAVVTAAVLIVVAVYVPHVLAVGRAVIGYLPDYLNTGGYGSGQQYRLLGLLLPGAAVAPAAVVIVVVTLAWAVFRSDPLRPERSALVVVGIAILVTTPTLPWYTPLLLALAAMNARPEWLGVVIAPTVEYLSVGAGQAGLDGATELAYALGLLVLAVGSGIRWVSSSRSPLAARTTQPLTQPLTQTIDPNRDSRQRGS